MLEEDIDHPDSKKRIGEQYNALYYKLVLVSSFVKVSW